MFVDGVFDYICDPYQFTLDMCMFVDVTSTRMIMCAKF